MVVLLQYILTTERCCLCLCNVPEQQWRCREFWCELWSWCEMKAVPVPQDLTTDCCVCMFLNVIIKKPKSTALLSVISGYLQLFLCELDLPNYIKCCHCRAYTFSNLSNFFFYSNYCRLFQAKEFVSGEYKIFDMIDLLWLSQLFKLVL